jgi:hypothetical protein
MTSHSAALGSVTPLRRRMIEDIVNVPRIFRLAKKLIHSMSLNADRLINRAMVAGCVISATRNYLKLHMPRTLNPLLSNLHAKTQKLWKHSAKRVGGFRPRAAYWSAPR